jgi:hypothetical protein
MQETQGDTRFVLKVWPQTKDVYVSVEELTKSQVSFNPNPPKMSQRLTWFTLSISMKRRAIQTSRGLTTILVSSRATLAVEGTQSPRVTNVTRSSRERGKVLLLEVGILKRAQIFSQEQDSRVKLRERRESLRTEY